MEDPITVITDSITVITDRVCYRQVRKVCVFVAHLPLPEKTKHYYTTYYKTALRKVGSKNAHLPQSDSPVTLQSLLSH